MEAYTIDYFIDFFKDVEEKHFTLSSDASGLDAYGWLTNPEQNALFNMVKHWGLLTDANDGLGPYVVFGNTIKERVINFLYFVKDKRAFYET